MKIRDHKLPIAYQYAIGSYGQREHIGAADNPEISKYMNYTWFDDNRDSVPWCSAFMNWCMMKAGLDRTESPRAKSWLKWGLDIDDPVKGDVVILTRDGGGHVGFFVTAGRGRVAILGGNQNDSVCVQDYDAADVLGYRTVFEKVYAAKPDLIYAESEVEFEEDIVG